MANTDSQEQLPDNQWCLYIILSSDNRLYTGITNNVERRWHAHLNTPRGAKFFRGRSPQKLLYLEQGFDRSSASRREAEIKKLTRSQKLALIARQDAIDWHSQLNLPQSSSTSTRARSVLE